MTPKKTKILPCFAFASGAIAFALAGCGGNPSSSTPVSSANSSNPAASSQAQSSENDTTFNGTTYYENLANRVSFDKTNTNNIDEAFAGGMMSDTYWNTLTGVWQNDSASYPHNGVQSRNLFYVNKNEKTMLAFKGRGVYSSESDTLTTNGYRKPEGACIISKNHLGPGRYEINMAAMPREGGVTAMWTYCTTTGSEATSQNEIDIEVGGNASETYKREWCTTWTTHTSKATANVDCSSLTYLNDGRIHKYTFDWYTNYKNRGERRVDWFLDGVLIASTTGEEVSETEMPLWVGLWFPNWSSVATFDTDYLLVDSIKYTAFDESQYYETCRAKSGYTQVAPSSSGIQNVDYSVIASTNKLSNGDFESLELCKQDQSYFGWFLDSASAGTIALDSDHTKGASSLKLTSGSGNDATHGEYLMQTISNAYPGYQYTYSIDAKKLSAATDAQIEIHYSTIKGSALGGTQTIKLDSTEWKTYQGKITLPENAGNLRFDLVVNDGSALFDNGSVIYSLGN